MKQIIVMTTEELIGIISNTLDKKFISLKEVIENGLHPKKKNITVKEAAKELNVSILTVRNYIKKGYLDAFKIGRRIVISQKSIEKALKEVKSLKYRR